MNTSDPSIPAPAAGADGPRARKVQALFDLRGKVALVTGGSRGLGLQMARALGEAGAKVFISSRKAEDLSLAAAQLREQGLEVAWAAADASQAPDILELVSQTRAQFGDIDVLVNNAGATWGAPAQDHPLEAWDKVMNLNVRGYFLLAQAVAKQCMIPRRRGSIINLASIAGLGGNPAFMQTVAYNTSKGAVVNFTRALACEWGHLGIRVNALAPGFFPSKMTAGFLQAVGQERIAAQSPLQRVGDDEDLAGATVLLASDAGKHITGQVLAIDGGVSALVGG